MQVSYRMILINPLMTVKYILIEFSREKISNENHRPIMYKYKSCINQLKNTAKSIQ